MAMKRGCPNSQCLFYQKAESVIRSGHYFRKNDSRLIQRFQCQKCQKRFSAATFSLAFNQKKRRVNRPLMKLLCSGVSMRRCALLLNIHQITVKRKFLFLSQLVQKERQKLVEVWKENKVLNLCLDDLITIEHTKLKPLSVSVAIDENTRTILSLKVSRIPAFGHLAEKSRKKYGIRRSQLKYGLTRLFEEIAPFTFEHATIKSDQHKLYPEFIARYFPNSIHQTYKSYVGCVAGQGELKKVHFDPLFDINHTLAMLRANVNRLIRRSWCTTKIPLMLEKHLEIYAYFHNTQLI